MNWEFSKFKGGKKWVQWGTGCWVTWWRNKPAACHIGFRKVYQGEWQMTPEAAMQKLEKMHLESLAAN